MPTREAMLKGLAVTGGVITSAGVVLAGTFSVLAVLPLVALTQIGITVALGVLLDTLIVRSILVPALTFELGERSGGRRRWGAAGGRPTRAECTSPAARHDRSSGCSARRRWSWPRSSMVALWAIRADRRREPRRRRLGDR